MAQNLNKRRLVVGIIGSTRADTSQLDAASALGAALMGAGCRIVTGGLGGVMEAVSRGARQSPDWEDGRIIGVIPGLDASAANPWVDVVIPSGMNYARNVLVVSTSDVLIAIAGGAGTLSEIALAWQHNKPVIALDIGEGWAPRLAGEVLDDRHTRSIQAARSVDEAVRLALKLGPDTKGTHGF